MRGLRVFRIGNHLKRLLIVLAKSHRRKTPIPKPAKSTWHFSPLKREKEILSLLAKEHKPPKPHILAKFPLLGQWLNRHTEVTKE